MKKLYHSIRVYTVLLCVLIGSSTASLSAQHLCFTSKLSEEKADVLFEVYAQPNYIAEMADTLKSPYELASFSSKLGFDASKMDFVGVTYNPELWEMVFADKNPMVERSKGKKGTSIYLSAVDLKPSSKTNISKATLLYTARFKSKSGKGSSIKKKDFRLAYSALDTITNQATDPMIAYATYDGKEYPIQTCDVPASEKREKTDKEDMISFFAPNPACDVVKLQTFPIGRDKFGIDKFGVDRLGTDKASETVHFLLYDLNGKAKLQRQIQARIGEALEWTLELDGIEQGLYIALVQIGQERYERKLLVMPCATNETVPSAVNRTVNQN